MTKHMTLSRISRPTRSENGRFTIKLQFYDTCAILLQANANRDTMLFINIAHGRVVMSATALMTALLMGQSAFSLAVETPSAQVAPNVAYTELAAGRSDAALRILEGGSLVRASDPAALINLAAAYSAAGYTDKAIASYRAAIASPDRYSLELADGTWMDSRLAARTALKRLMTANARASR